MVNLEIREFSKKVVEIVNQSPLPIEVKRLSLIEVLQQVNLACDTVLQKEAEERGRENVEENIDE